MSDQGFVEMTSSVNQSTATNQTAVDGCVDVDTSADPFFIVVYSLVFLAGFSLNAFIMKFYFCRAHRQASSSMTVYLKNLAAADFLLCLCLPIRITKYVSTTRLVFCHFGFSAFFLNMYASILFMGYIAANRYLKIVHGSAAPHILQTVRAARIISTVSWVFLLALMSTYIIMLFHSLKHLTSVPTRCETLHSDQLAVLYTIIQTFSTISFLFVLVSLIFFYYNTSRRVSEARQRQPTSSSSKKLAKSHRNMLVLVCVFCVCFVPFHMFRLIDIFLRKNCSMRTVSYYLMEVTVMVSALNVCLDPLIYFIFCKAFRAQLSRRGEARNG
ncbi:P2Y purinoceptor 14-like isoform X1 [Acanthopagrus latus]|uniref:P2Y purinoceptor 14-like isoform X1 n=1 Tax=Acanthopagrus latus TaxID=8177 RepID=UPI00187C7F75|nr:P2Y purinoceptor 14-like isoform X1 [Acanthopagrus latus]XP_036951778.1 P2Y purinoceptor 14-like isoform X1 [Acanthopagrus latus]XP_036951783.1 P2Y purinoceptor 14-like isoform X1 [Acanthopagrus latus]XP_036951789.1 P2Y purinoceptor 14-like isoform X1 [Acanthopagrus latus]